MNSSVAGPPLRVAVVGAGRMGSGIAYAFAISGFRVTLRDIDESAIARGRAAVVASLHSAKDRGTLSEEPASVLERLDTGLGPAAIGAVDLVIEAVPEIPDLKRSVLAQVVVGVPEQTVIATNTSSISISELARPIANPSRFVGLHFFNPVPVSRLVEIVRADATSQATVEKALGWTRAIGKEGIVIADSPGFATSRLGLAIGLEAIRMLESGVGSAEDIDRGMVLGYGFPIGPIRLTDIVGLDVRLEIAEYLSRHLGPRFDPPNLLRQHVAEGRLGRKSGRGFYEWEDKSIT